MLDAGYWILDVVTARTKDEAGYWMLDVVTARTKDEAGYWQEDYDRCCRKSEI